MPPPRPPHQGGRQRRQRRRLWQRLRRPPPPPPPHHNHNQDHDHDDGSHASPCSHLTLPKCCSQHLLRVVSVPAEWVCIKRVKCLATRESKTSKVKEEWLPHLVCFPDVTPEPEGKSRKCQTSRGKNLELPYSNVSTSFRSITPLLSYVCVQHSVGCFFGGGFGHIHVGQKPSFNYSNPCQTSPTSACSNQAQSHLVFKKNQEN